MRWHRKELTAAETGFELALRGRWVDCPLAPPVFAASDGTHGFIIYAERAGEAPAPEAQREWLRARLADCDAVVLSPGLPLHLLGGRAVVLAPLRRWPSQWPSPDPGRPPVALYEPLPPAPLPAAWRGGGEAASAALLQTAGAALERGPGFYLRWSAEIPPAQWETWFAEAPPAPWFIDLGDGLPGAGWAAPPGEGILLAPDPPPGDSPVMAAPAPAVRGGAGGGGPPLAAWLARSGPWPLATYDAAARACGGPDLRAALAAGWLAVRGGAAHAETAADAAPVPPPDAALLAALAPHAPAAALKLAIVTGAGFPEGLEALAAERVESAALLALLKNDARPAARRLRLRAALDRGEIAQARALAPDDPADRAECEALAAEPSADPPAADESPRAAFFHAYRSWRRNDFAAAAARAGAAAADEAGWPGACAALRDHALGRRPAPRRGDDRAALWGDYFRASARLWAGDTEGSRAGMTGLWREAQARGWSVLAALAALKLADFDRQAGAFDAALARCAEAGEWIAAASGCHLHGVRRALEGGLLIERGRPRAGLARQTGDTPAARLWRARARQLLDEPEAALAELAPLSAWTPENYAALAEVLRAQVRAVAGASHEWSRNYGTEIEAGLAPVKAALRALAGETVAVAPPPDPARMPELHAFAAPLQIAARLLTGQLAAGDPEAAAALAGPATIAVPLLRLLAARRPALLADPALGAAAERWADLLAAEAPRTSLALHEALQAVRPRPLEPSLLALAELARAGGPAKAEALRGALAAAAVRRPPQPGDWPLPLADGELGVAGSPWAGHPAMRAAAEQLLARVTLAPPRAARAPEGRWIDGLYFGSEASLALLADIETCAPSPIPVYIRGPSGAGKEGAAQLIHKFSRRRGALVAVNCATLERELADAQLFGARRGAYTGALEDRPGLVEQAEGGTLFLDELLDLPLPVQAKLLRLLESGEFYRLGETRPRRAAARVVCAAAGDVEAALAAGRLRGDLWTRVGGIVLEVPPLAARRAEILPLFEHFAASLARQEGLARPALSAALAARLVEHDWPGQVRELRRAAEHALLRARGRGELRPEDLPPQLRPPVADETAAPGADLPARLEAYERALITEALKRAEGIAARAARELGLSRQALFQKMKRLGIEAAEKD